MFFDVSVDERGRETWQTRIYHEEAGDETVVATADATAWASWVLDRLGSSEAESAPAPAAADVGERLQPAKVHQLTVEVVAVRLVKGPRAAGARDAALVEVELKIAGLSSLERSLGAAVIAAVVGQRGSEP